MRSDKSPACELCSPPAAIVNDPSQFREYRRHSLHFTGKFLAVAILLPIKRYIEFLRERQIFC